MKLALEGQLRLRREVEEEEEKARREEEQRQMEERQREAAKVIKHLSERVRRHKKNQRETGRRNVRYFCFHLGVTAD